MPGSKLSAEPQISGGRINIQKNGKKQRAEPAKVTLLAPNGKVQIIYLLRISLGLV
jgi:hypothetical protein